MAKPIYDGTEAKQAALLDLIEVVSGAIVSKPLLDTGPVKLVLFGMDAGQEITPHSAPFTATIQTLAGHLKVSVGAASFDLHTGDHLVLPANVPHGIVSVQAAKFLLTMAKGA